MRMMRFERLWSTEGRICDWPLEFSLNTVIFLGGWGCFLCSAPTCIQNRPAASPQSSLRAGVGLVTFSDWGDGFSASVSHRLAPDLPAPRGAEACHTWRRLLCVVSGYRARDGLRWKHRRVTADRTHESSGSTSRPKRTSLKSGI